MQLHSLQQDNNGASIMNKTKYIRTSSGSVMPVYSHVIEQKTASQGMKTPSNKSLSGNPEQRKNIK